MATIRLTKNDDGTTVNANPGDVIVIELAENATTGYQWTAVPDPSGVAELHDSELRPAHGETSPDPNTAIIGAPGTRVLEFHVANQGHGHIALHCSRVWEGEGSAVDRFSLDVISND